MEAKMRRGLMPVIVGLILGSLLLGKGTETETTVERAFVQGGDIRLRLSSGDYVVRAGASDHIRVELEAQNPEGLRALKKVRAEVEVSGTVATIRTKGPTSDVRTFIEIPARSNLYLRVRAGDVRIDGIEGNKDIRMTAGDLKIEVLPASYAHVHGSVTFGDVRASPLGISKDGIVNSFDWNGGGKYTLRASVFAGDLTLSPAH
jgi:hypothetical protein